MPMARFCVLAAQDVSDLHGQTSQNRAIGIYNMPFALVQIRFWQISLHRNPSKRGVNLSKKRPKSIAKFRVSRPLCKGRLENRKSGSSRTLYSGNIVTTL